MSEYTAGPWQAGREDMDSYDGLSGELFKSVYADDPRAGTHLSEDLPLVIARLPGNILERDELIANARLIAASPSLYEYVAMCAASGDNKAKQLLEKCGLAESKKPETRTD